jgi:hypothetical protein
LDSLLGSCAAVADSPGVFFPEELLSAYPEASFLEAVHEPWYRPVYATVQAKVILVERDIQKWHTSCTVVVGEMFRRPVEIVGELNLFLDYAGVRVFRKTWLAYFRARNASEVLENVRVVYSEHYARVRRLVPTERLSNYELGSGSKPLLRIPGEGRTGRRFPPA